MNHVPKSIRKFVEERKTAYGQEYINSVDLKKEVPEFSEMLNMITMGADNLLSGIITFKGKIQSPVKQMKVIGSYRALLYTENYFYVISCTIPKDKNDGYGYLGCVMSLRKPCVGETWTSGGDLIIPDGDFCKDTFIRIMGRIIRNEMVGLGQ